MKKSTLNKLVITFVVVSLTLCSCGSQSHLATIKESDISIITAEALNYDEMVWESAMDITYAKELQIEKSNDYYRITISDATKFFVVPKSAELPQNVPDEMIVLYQPLDSVYLVASSAYDLVDHIDALDYIRLTGVKRENMYLKSVLARMDEGKLLYAGKYSAPDYELLIGEKCDLAIENTMIFHEPQAKEKLEELGIPVLVEYSSYENNPLGRLEWIKLYGVLFQREEISVQIFDDEVEKIATIMSQDKNGAVAVFFHVNTNGSVTVRKSGDYISKMIEMAGGEYALYGMADNDENALSTMNIQMEDFYLAAKDCDVLIYNSTIEGELESIDDLLALSPVFADFKAVKNGRVYCTGRNFFQEITGMGDFIEDLNKVFLGIDEDYHYLFLLE